MNVQADYNNFSYGQLYIRVTAYVACAFSIVGILFVLTSHLLFPRLRSTASEFVVMLVLSDILYNLAYLMKPDKHTSSAWCTTQAFFVTFATNAQYLWYFCIAFTIQKVVLQKDWSLKTSKVFMKRYRCRAHLICWSSALILALLPLSTGKSKNWNGSYMPSQYPNVTDAPLFCWIKSTDQKSQIFEIFFLTLPALLLLYIMFVSYHTWKLLDNLAKARCSASEETYSDFYNRSSYLTKRRLKWYPMIFLVQITALWLDRAWDTVTGSGNSTLFAIHVILLNLQGFMNSMVFGCTEVVLYEWTRCLGRKKSGLAKEQIGFEYTVVVDNQSEFSAANNDIDSKGTNNM